MNAPCPHQRILIIDDNQAIHGDFKKIFAKGSGSVNLDATEASLFGESSSGARAECNYSLDSAYQGAEGLELVQRAMNEGRPYSMAFVDVRMPPGWDGIETIARIWEVYPDLQTVVCTAYSDYSWDDMNQRLGNTDRLVILKKPFDNVEVLQLAGALTEKWSLLQQTRNHTLELVSLIEKRTEQLRKSEERFRLITENAADLIALVDPEGRRLYNSPSYRRLLGYDADDLSTTLAFAQVHPSDAERVKVAFLEVAQAGIGRTLEYQMQHKDGSWRTLESQGVPFRNAAGQIEGVLTVARDITERKLAEQERHAMQLQLQQAQKLESIGRLAAGVAHEINTPTQYIGDNTRFVRDSFAELQPALCAAKALLNANRENHVTPELIQSTDAVLEKADLDYLTVEIPKAIEESLQGVERVAKIVRAMKEFSHPGSDEKTPVDLNQAIESTLTVARNEWKYVADLVTDFDSALPQVTCLPGEFNQVILNLVVNAAHAIGDTLKDRDNAKGTITVSTRRDGNWVEVRVRDTGTGIPVHAHDKIFDPFFTTKGVGKGTGQGLAIAHSVVVDKHGGTITFETEIGKGTVFVIRIPISPNEKSAHEGATQRKASCA